MEMCGRPWSLSIAPVKLLRELANPNLHDIANMSFHVELWDRHADHLRWVVAAAGNMRTGGPAKTASALERVAQGMTPAQRGLYGSAFDTFTGKLNSMQGNGLDAASAAARVIELAEQVPAPSRGAVGADAELMLKAAREQTDAELDALRLQIVGLD